MSFVENRSIKMAQVEFQLQDTVCTQRTTHSDSQLFWSWCRKWTLITAGLYHTCAVYWNLTFISPFWLLTLTGLNHSRVKSTQLWWLQKPHHHPGVSVVPLMNLPPEQWPMLTWGINVQHAPTTPLHTHLTCVDMCQSKAIHLYLEVNGCLTEKGFNHIAAELYTVWQVVHLRQLAAPLSAFWRARSGF